MTFAPQIYTQEFPYNSLLCSMAYFYCHHFNAHPFVQPTRLCLILPSDRLKGILILSGVSSGLLGALGSSSPEAPGQVCPTH